MFLSRNDGAETVIIGSAFSHIHIIIIIKKWYDNIHVIQPRQYAISLVSLGS